MKDLLKRIDLMLIEAGNSTPMKCMECGKKFKKVIGKNTIEAKCPKCGGYDTEPE
jgi:predicted Zn-ribbon and HTH transcriptional regulator